MKYYVTDPKNNVYMKACEIPTGNGKTDAETGIINIFDEVEYQTLMGFGGALTESAAYNYARLTPEQKKDFLEKCYGENGLNYRVGRLHINACDFSLSSYTETEEGDMTLSTFNINRDKQYIIPFVKDVTAFTKAPLFLFASPWSAPAYMKDNNSIVKGGRLREDCKKLWALYFAKFIKAYREEGIDIAAVTVQNEPKAIQTWESLVYTAEEEREFACKYLIPTLEQEGLSHVKVIIWDHNKERVYDRARDILSDNPAADKIWGIGYHWYSGEHFEGLDMTHEAFDKPLLCTEFCIGINTDDLTVAERYAREICGDLNHHTVAICDWNILLSTLGGPYHNRTAASVCVGDQVYESKDGGLYAPVLYDAEGKKLVYTPCYYYIAHFAGFMKPGAVRIGISRYTDRLKACAAKNSDGSVVLTVFNDSDTIAPLNIRYHGDVTSLSVEAHTICTFIL